MTERCSIGRFFLLWWVLATAAGWGLTTVLLFGAIPYLERLSFFGKLDWSERYAFLYYTLDGAVYEAIIGAMIGVVIGALQWLVLRRHIPRAYWWIAATVIGLSLGMAAGILIVTPESLFVRIGGLWWQTIQAAVFLPVTGTIVGLSQRLVLGRHFGRTWWWLVQSALGWGLLVLFFGWVDKPSLSEVGLVVGGAGFVASLGIVPGIISGVTLLFISRRSKENSR